MSIREHRVVADRRGKLIAIEGQRDIPFDVKRIFYMYGMTSDIPRGEHAHRNTKQYLIALSGACKVTLDDGKHRVTYDLDRSTVGIFQDIMVWGTMHDFTPDCVLLVLASEHYEEADYIRSYDQFCKTVRV